MRGTRNEEVLGKGNEIFFRGLDDMMVMIMVYGG